MPEHLYDEIDDLRSKLDEATKLILELLPYVEGARREEAGWWDARDDISIVAINEGKAKYVPVIDALLTRMRTYI